MPTASPESPDWPGKRLGLPAEGPRSVGRVGRRLLGILIDWGLCYGIVLAFLRPDPFGFKTLALFVVLEIVFLILANGTIGQLIVGLRVVPIVPGYLGIWRPILRTILLAVLIPAVIYDKDQRGLHDRWAGTVLVRR
jgi:uncharacterized RDD family membrane protein YckC